VNLALELVNSEWWRGRPGAVDDKLRDSQWLAAFAAELDLEPPGPARVRELTALRTSLRALVEGGGDLRELDRYVAAAPVRRRVVDGEVVLEPVSHDWTWASSEIAAAFLELEDRSRIKTCANHECQWSFYDASKNRSRRWCGSATCGTADKVRRFRARQRAARA
jgi:predicted RNA-binding Zn ribbon-like protein